MHCTWPAHHACESMLASLRPDGHAPAMHLPLKATTATGTTAHQQATALQQATGTAADGCCQEEQHQWVCPDRSVGGVVLLAASHALRRCHAQGLSTPPAMLCMLCSTLMHVGASALTACGMPMVCTLGRLGRTWPCEVLCLWTGQLPESCCISATACKPKLHQQLQLRKLPGQPMYPN